MAKTSTHEGKSDRPVPLPVSPRHIPDALKQVNQWVVWRYVWDTDQAKWTKIPYQAQHPHRKASSTSPETWTSYEMALATYQAGDADGIGFCFTKPYVGIDLDHCRDPETGEIDAWADAIVSEISTYWEVSPSGTGLHALATGTLPDSGRKKADVEMYDGGRFFTVTGCHLHDTPHTIESCQAAIEALHARTFSAPEPHMPPSTNGHGPTMADTAVLDHARAARNGGKFNRLWAGDARGYPSDSEADLALCILLAFWTQDHGQIDRLFRQSQRMRPKWDEQRGEQTYGQMTVATALRRQTEHYHPPQNAAGEGPGSPEEIHLTDVGNGLRLVEQFGPDLRYVTTWKRWLNWQDGRWTMDPDGGVEWHAKQVISGLYTWAQSAIAALVATVGGDAAEKKQRDEQVEKIQHVLEWAHRSESGTHIDLMVKRARSNPKVRITHDSLDTDPMLLQVIGSVIDLRTGERRAPRRSDLITKQAHVVYDPDATCPLWRAALRRWQGYPQADTRLDYEDWERRRQRAERMITYLQRLVGWSLTADVTEQILLFLYGKGQNGKSVFLNTIRTMLGDYAMQAPPNFLLAKDREQHPTELSDLFGKRFVSTIEVEKGKQFALALVKMLTGGEHMRARRMREDFWEFAPTWKIWLAANDKPKVKVQDKATWRRIKLIPFEVTIPDTEVDTHLSERLLTELPGILNWAIEGCLAWQRDGLQEPEEVTRATEAYREESDLLNQFFRDCCTLHRRLKTQSSVLHKAFETYTGEPTSAVEFAELMISSGYEKDISAGRMFWKGIGLNRPQLVGLSGE